jgi:DNA-binding beta-propeller fold protein YncE
MLIHERKNEAMTSLLQQDFSLAYYGGNRTVGSLAVIHRRNGETRVEPIETAAETGLEQDLKPIFVGLTEDADVILLDPKTKELKISPSFPADAFPAHIYEDPGSNRSWFMNDGDKQTGNDRLNCGDRGSSVTVVENIASREARFLRTICVGRGHHQAAYTFPTESAPGVPRRVYVSNLNDGTVSVIGNDPSESDTFLALVETINLCEPDKEDSVSVTVPNKSYPHGLVFSRLTGKVYNLNNGYGTIAVIDPVTNGIERRMGFKGHSNLFMTPAGRYVIGRGADRKSDPHHVIANLTALDLETLQITDRLLLPDIYVSKYYFNPDGTKLYLTTSASGSPDQQAHIKSDALLVIDLTALPKVRLIRELRLGTSCGSLAFSRPDGAGGLVFASNSEAGTVTVIDGLTDEILEHIPVMRGMSHSRVWTL